MCVERAFGILKGRCITMKDSFDKTWDEAESELAQKIANNEARE
jgi:hypothetical protein